jgi:hypothetical protein
MHATSGRARSKKPAFSLLSGDIAYFHSFTFIEPVEDPGPVILEVLYFSFVAEYDAYFPGIGY